MDIGFSARRSFWSNPGGSATWDVGISSLATYHILLSVSNTEPGAELLVEIAGNSFSVEVLDTGNHDSDKTVDVGKITFPNAEQTRLRVLVADPATWQPTNIRSVKLIPSNR